MKNGLDGLLGELLKDLRTGMPLGMKRKSIRVSELTSEQKALYARLQATIIGNTDLMKDILDMGESMAVLKDGMALIKFGSNGLMISTLDKMPAKLDFTLADLESIGIETSRENCSGDCEDCKSDK